METVKAVAWQDDSQSREINREFEALIIAQSDKRMAQYRERDAKRKLDGLLDMNSLAIPSMVKADCEAGDYEKAAYLVAWMARNCPRI